MAAGGDGDRLDQVVFFPNRLPYGGRQSRNLPVQRPAEGLGKFPLDAYLPGAEHLGKTLPAAQATVDASVHQISRPSRALGQPTLRRPRSASFEDILAGLRIAGR